MGDEPIRRHGDTVPLGDADDSAVELLDLRRTPVQLVDCGEYGVRVDEHALAASDRDDLADDRGERVATLLVLREGADGDVQQRAHRIEHAVEGAVQTVDMTSPVTRG